MKKSELLQMIREEYGRALITEAPSKRAQAIKVASDAMYKHLKEFEKAAKKVLEKLKAEGIRAEADFGSSTMGDKVRNASMLKIPYIVTIGDKEEEKGTLAVKKRGEEKPKFGVKLDKFLEELKEEIRERK